MHFKQCLYLIHPFLGAMLHRVNATVRLVGLEFIVTRLVRPVITGKIVKRNATAKMEQLATISPVRLSLLSVLCELI